LKLQEAKSYAEKQHVSYTAYSTLTRLALWLCNSLHTALNQIFLPLIDSMFM